MIKLIETTKFKDKKKPPIVTERLFSTLNGLYKALKKSKMSNELVSKLRAFQKIEISYKDATTKIEIVNGIILTDI